MTSKRRAEMRRAARDAANVRRPTLGNAAAAQREHVKWCQAVATRITGLEPTEYPDGTRDVPMTDAQRAEYVAEVHPEHASAHPEP